MRYRTFYSLCQLSAQNNKSFYTANQILDQLDAEFRSVYTYKTPPVSDFERALALARKRSGSRWKAGWADDIARIIHIWAVCKANSKSDPRKALTRLRSDYFRYWKIGLNLIECYQANRPIRELEDVVSFQSIYNTDEPSVAKDFEQAFGGFDLNTQDIYRAKNITKHTSEINTAIHAAFNKIGRFIDPAKEILVGVWKDDIEYGYRAVGEIIFNQDEAENKAIHRRSSNPRCRVLIIENELNYLERMWRLLEDRQFDVELATNITDAVNKALRLQPDIISLDLHLPDTPEAFKAAPHSGNADAGLRILEAIREKAPATYLRSMRVLVPTTLYNKDLLMEGAKRLKVPVYNFVPKGITVDGGQWEGYYMQTILRLRQEIELNAWLPAEHSWIYPVIKIDKRSDLQKGRLNLLVNGRTFSLRASDQGRLLGCLLKKVGKKVANDEIDQYVVGSNATENMRKKWLTYLREKIHTDWLSLKKGSPERPELAILESVEGGLVLHAVVEWS